LKLTERKIVLYISSEISDEAILSWHMLWISVCTAVSFSTLSTFIRNCRNWRWTMQHVAQY